MKTDYIFLCGEMRTRFGLEDAGRELVCALHSNDPDIAVLASAILESRSQTAGTLDATFGTGGRVTTFFGGDGLNGDDAHSVVVPERREARGRRIDDQS
jgi:hypothetical protein